MNNNDFIQHFYNACEYLKIDRFRERTFLVCPVMEEGKKYLSDDDIMRLGMLSRCRKCSFEQVIRIFTWREGYYPLWITITPGDDMIEMRTSLRMRKAGQNDDKKFYPFRVEKM